MSARKLFISALLLATACGEEVVSNTANTDAVLDLLTPRFRFGETLGALKRGGMVVEVDSTETGSASARLALSSERLGFTALRIIGPKVENADSREDIRAQEFVFFTDPIRNNMAEQEATRSLTRVFHRPGVSGCAGNSATREERVLYWEDAGGGGAALFVPIHHAESDRHAPVRLVVFPEPRKISDVAMQYRREPCDAASG